MAPKKSEKKGKGKLDVRSPADVKGLMDTIHSHPLTIILIHADYCGHCQTYKKDIWEPLQEKAETAKNGMAAIHYDQLEATPFADAKIKGYPSVIVVGKKKMAEFKDEEAEAETEAETETTNAMPSAKAREMAAMEELLTKTEPADLPTTMPEVRSNVDVSEPETSASPPLDEEAESAREKTSAETKKSLLSKSGTAEATKPVQSIVPDEARDVLNSQLDSSVATEYEGSAADKAKEAKTGGSLYSSLLAATRVAAPAIALTAAAVAVSKRKGRKTRRSKSKSKRRGATKRRAVRKN